MSKTVQTTDREVAVAVTRLLLEDAELIAFKYDSGFTMHFQHALPRSDSGLPVQVSLVLRANWWTTSERKTPAAVPQTGRPFQAFELMTLVGNKVEHVEVGPDSSLSLLFFCGDSLRVAGSEQEWEFSWYVFVPSNFPGVDTWSINCDNLGNIEGSWPLEAGLPTAISGSHPQNSAPFP